MKKILIAIIGFFLISNNLEAKKWYEEKDREIKETTKYYPKKIDKKSKKNKNGRLDKINERKKLTLKETP